MDYTEALYADGFQPFVVIALKVDGPRILRRVVIAPDFLELIPLLKDTLATAVEDILELAKPPDDRQLRPGLTVEMRE